MSVKHVTLLFYRQHNTSAWLLLLLLLLLLLQLLRSGSLLELALLSKRHKACPSPSAVHRPLL
jgi:hypothetical protein